MSRLLFFCLFFSTVSFARHTDSIQLLYPVYENRLQKTRLHPFKYRVSQVFPSQALNDSLKLGCNFVSTLYLPADSIVTSYNICDSGYVSQIIKTESEGYLGHLEELLNLPYVLSPRLYKGSHQTELKLGVDCVSLVIYGRRKQGYKIPYCTPTAIKQYLQKTNEYKKGVILHFGTHLTVLYTANNPLKLEPHDLIIHAFKDKAEITPIGNTEFYTQPHQLFNWK